MSTFRFSLSFCLVSAVYMLETEVYYYKFLLYSERNKFYWYKKEKI